MKTLLFDPIYIAFADAQDAGRDYQAEHIAFLRAESARTGLNNEPLIVLLYGQEAAHCCCACRKPSHELAPIPASIEDAVAEFEGWGNDDGATYCPECLGNWEHKHGEREPRHWSYGD